MARLIPRKIINGKVYKMCSKCHKYIPETEFNRETKRGDRIQGYCRDCQSEYLATHYKEDK